jgi:hypothetical protein
MRNRKETPKDRLISDVEKRIRTTMVGAVAIIEDALQNGQTDLEIVFERLREAIFDKGNEQMRFAKNDLAKYRVESDRFHLELPFRRT